MITKRQVLQAIVGLIQVSDYELLNQRSVLSELAHPRDFDLVRQIARTVKSVYDHFDYTTSSEFLRSVAGKSDSFVDMKRRLLSDPKKKVEQRTRLAEALVELPNVTQLLALLPQSRTAEVEDLSRHVSALQNPG